MAEITAAIWRTPFGQPLFAVIKASPPQTKQGCAYAERGVD